MLKKTIKYLWSLKWQFARYFVVGIFGVSIDFLLMVALKEFAGFSPVAATAFSQILSITFIFLANKYWSFASHHQTRRQLVRYSMVLGFDYAYTVAMMYAGSDWLGFDYRLVRLVTIAIQVAWNFFLYKYFVYRKSEEVVAEKVQ
jgi:putative flippase GtrA